MTHPLHEQPLVAAAPRSEGEAELKVTLTRVETKLDLALGQHGVTLEDHERRLRDVEARPTVTPKGLVASIVATVTILGGVTAYLDRFYS